MGRPNCLASLDIAARIVSALAAMPMESAAMEIRPPRHFEAVHESSFCDPAVRSLQGGSFSKITSPVALARRQLISPSCPRESRAIASRSGTPRCRDAQPRRGRDRLATHRSSVMALASEGLRAVRTQDSPFHSPGRGAAASEPARVGERPAGRIHSRNARLGTIRAAVSRSPSYNKWWSHSEVCAGQ